MSAGCVRSVFTGCFALRFLPFDSFEVDLKIGWIGGVWSRFFDGTVSVGRLFFFASLRRDSNSGFARFRSALFEEARCDLEQEWEFSIDRLIDAFG